MRQVQDVFGTHLVAMVTPMESDGSISTSGLDALVEHLVAGGCDGIVVAGTTGESPTLGKAETAELIAAVADRAAGRARVIAGVGTYDTADSIERARAAAAAGAHALLVVTPYYSRPTQAGIIAHTIAIADATELPVMLYDIPVRAGVALAPDTLRALAAHPRIRAVKDAKGDLYEAMSVMADTGLAYYSGIDELNLPYLACGATGVVTVVGNAVPDRIAELIRAVGGSDLDTARKIDRTLHPLTDAIMGTAQGAVMAKAALAELRVIPHATVRLPLLAATPEQRHQVAAALAGSAVSV